VQKVLIVESSKEKFENLKSILTIKRDHFSSLSKVDPQNNVPTVPNFGFSYADSGENAIELVREAELAEDPFCLVVMNIDLARLKDSFFYPREIRKIDTQIQFIILTTTDNEYWEHISGVLGKRDFLAVLTSPFKPIQLQQLAIVFYEKWRLTKIANKKLSEVSAAYDLMVVERMKADQVSNAKSDFLSNMSHEIRTPLNILLGINEVLQNTNINSEQENYLKIAARSGDQLLKLLNNLLDLSKIEAGKETVVASQFSANKFFNNLFQVFKFKADSSNVKLITKVSEDLPECLIADSNKLKIILSNLIDNAIKFSENKKVTVSISKELSSKNGKIYIKGIVSDTGVGMPKEFMDNIFKSFMQADRPGSKKYAGTGLGLSITNKYVELLGGRIEVISKLNEGTKFSFIIPMQVSEDKDIEEETVFYEVQKKLSNQLNILLVEDNEESAQLIEIYLEKEDCELDIAVNGKEGLKLYYENNYDVIFMDMQMPVMDGFEATKAIRKYEQEKKRPRVPIIALTAYSRSNELDACISAGCEDVFRKPVKRSKIISYLHSIVGQTD